MKWTRTRILLLPYVVLLAVLVVVGCTSKQDPSEVLVTCGNHSCGELVMVTTDTSSDGFHYLNASLSPDGSQILFTADWGALPSDPRDPGDQLYTAYRQLVLMDKREGTAPAVGLEEQGAKLIRLFPRNNVWYFGDLQYLASALDDDKQYPIWESDSTVIFCLRNQLIKDTYRIYRADITDPDLAPFEPLFMEAADYVEFPSPPFSQHLEPALSPVLASGDRWLVFTRSSCALVDSFETCSGAALWALNMSTAGDSLGYGTEWYELTNEYSRVENPRWSPDGSKIVFSGGLDVAGSGRGAGTELFTIDFDLAAIQAGDPPAKDNNLQRLTFTSQAEGDPISGVLNSNPIYSEDGNTIFFVSTRRAPSITLHDRNIWRIPADGSLDPVIHYFTRSDEADPSLMSGNRILFSSALGFPTEMLNRLEEQAYQRLAATDTTGLTEVQLREAAAEERRQLEFFEGVMSHIYIYRP